MIQFLVTCAAVFIAGMVWHGLAFSAYRRKVPTPKSLRLVGFRRITPIGQMSRYYLGEQEVKAPFWRGFVQKDMKALEGISVVPKKTFTSLDGDVVLTEEKYAERLQAFNSLQGDKEYFFGPEAAQRMPKPMVACIEFY